MVNNKNIILTILMFILLAFCLTAEDKDIINNETKPVQIQNYYIKDTEEGISIFQHFSWEKLENLLAYEFLLEQKNANGSWKLIEKRETKDNFIDLALTPGTYRYRITEINLLEQREAKSKYRYFDVLLAKQPSVDSVSPDTIYFDNIYDNFFVIRGDNFRDGTTFALIDKKGKTLYGKLIQLDKKGNKAKIEFDVDKIAPNEYNLVVVDESKLKDTTTKILFKFKKPVDTYLSGGYAFTGFAKNKTFKEYFNANFAILGAVLRLSIMPIKRKYGSFGFNITCAGSYIKNKHEYYTVKAGYVITQLNAVFLLPIIRHKINFDAHFGGGASFLINPQFNFSELDIKNPNKWYWGLTANLGTAVQVYLYKKLYLEVNLDHIFSFRQDFPLYTAQASLSVGWEF